VVWSQSGSGAISFLSANCSLSGGACSVKMTGASGGTITVYATYGGDANNAGGSSGTADLMIMPGRTSLSVSCVPSAVTVGSSASCTATLSHYAGPVVGETITWSQTAGVGSISFSPSASCILLAGGVCSITVRGVNQGSATVQAVYLGDPNNQGSLKTSRLKVTA
jgi:hypothetical protein